LLTLKLFCNTVECDKQRIPFNSFENILQ
jgi:hypothetical protein